MWLVKVKFWKKSNGFIQLDDEWPNRITNSIFPKNIVPDGSFFVGFRGKDTRGMNKDEIYQIVKKAEDGKVCYIIILILKDNEDAWDYLNPKTKVRTFC